MKTLKTTNEFIQLDDYGRVISFRSRIASDQEFILSGDYPAFMLQYRDDDHFVEIDVNSNPAKCIEENDKITYIYHNVGNTFVNVTTCAFIENDTIHFTASIDNPNQVPVTGIAYPIIVCPYELGLNDQSEALLYPRNAGILYRAPQPYHLEPDSFHAWRFTPENGDTYHYPGQIFAQFMAYYNSRAGIYISCDDIHGNLKLIKPVHRKGIRLGFFHADDWRRSKELGYHILLKSFTGDWYQAADIYREWSSAQQWSIPILKRTEIPDWLLDSPPHIVLRIQGLLDEGPCEPNNCFQPYENAIPLLESVSNDIESPIAPIIMAWENKGPWVYPDCFPPAGGDESLSQFTTLARKNGWHIGTYCNGTRWVTGHYWSGYDGKKYLDSQNGQDTLCHTIDGSPWKEVWDASWRESFSTCLGVEKTRQIAEDFCKRLVKDGLDYIQFLDQNVGCTAFPCYSKNHNHPPMPGKWMTHAMEKLGQTFDKIRDESNRDIVFALEQPCCEYFMPYIQICDVRIGPPGHPYNKNGFIPLAMYLFHEFILFQGAFGCGQEPYHLPIRTAANLVWGIIPGGVLTDSGDLVNRDHPMPWSVWDPKLGNNSQTISMIKHATALRRGIGKPYLVYGKMLPPAHIENIEILHWEFNGNILEAPSVFHSAWESSDGKFAIVLANWTDSQRKVSISDSRLGVSKTVIVPPLDCILIEQDIS